jgi:uncharacterized membrane protein YfcA
MEVFGYIASILIGITLGLIGGGGSILTVPILVYLFNIEASIATTYSLLIVGITSCVGSFSYFKNGFIHLRTTIYFGLPSVIGVLFTRRVIVPSIPDQINFSEQLFITKNTLFMLLFAVLMLTAAYSMIHSHLDHSIKKANQFNKLIVQGLSVGIITGLIGAGGGFLIIPVLVNILRLSMKSAVGTSLFIISINSLVGFSISNYAINWSLLLTILIMAIIGIIIGIRLSKSIDGSKLKPAFGWFILSMGVFIIIKETLLP